MHVVDRPFLRQSKLRQKSLVVKYREGTGLMDPLALSSVSFTYDCAELQVDK